MTNMQNAFPALAATTFYRVTYPLITCDAQRDFTSRDEAEAFAAKRREIISASPYMTNRAWQRISITEVCG